MSEIAPSNAGVKGGKTDFCAHELDQAPMYGPPNQRPGLTPLSEKLAPERQHHIANMLNLKVCVQGDPVQGYGLRGDTKQRDNFPVVGSPVSRAVPSDVRSKSVPDR